MLNIQEKIMFRFRRKKASPREQKILYYTLENHLLPHKLHVSPLPPPSIYTGGREVFSALRKRKKNAQFFIFIFFDGSMNMKKYCPYIKFCVITNLNSSSRQFAVLFPTKKRSEHKNDTFVFHQTQRFQITQNLL